MLQEFLERIFHVALSARSAITWNRNQPHNRWGRWLCSEYGTGVSPRFRVYPENTSSNFGIFPDAQRAGRSGTITLPDLQQETTLNAVADRRGGI